MLGRVPLPLLVGTRGSSFATSYPAFLICSFFSAFVYDVRGRIDFGANTMENADLGDASFAADGVAASSGEVLERKRVETLTCCSVGGSSDASHEAMGNQSLSHFWPR